MLRQTIGSEDAFEEDYESVFDSYADPDEEQDDLGEEFLFSSNSSQQNSQSSWNSKSIGKQHDSRETLQERSREKFRISSSTFGEDLAGGSLLDLLDSLERPQRQPEQPMMRQTTVRTYRLPSIPTPTGDRIEIPSP